MTRLWCAALSALLVGLGAAAEVTQAQRRPAATPVSRIVLTPSHASPLSPDDQRALVEQYCVTCHNDRAKAGGLSLAAFDPAHAGRQADVAEKMVRKLRAGMMPPANARRPPEGTLDALALALETTLDAAAAAEPDPGWRPFQRLNRAEYARSIRELLDIDVDVNAFLPADTVSDGFDNIADAQSFSPTLMEGYLRAASRISGLAVGDRAASAREATYKVPRTASQMHRVEGAPFGTRGGISVVHVFPADGEYKFRLMLHAIPTGQLFGSTVKGERVEVSINGQRVAVLEINPRMSESDTHGMNIEAGPVHVKAGPQRVTAAFIERFEAPVDDLIAPIEHTLADTQIGSGYGITTLPHLRDFTISGPLKVTGVSATPSRRRIFTCRPTTASEEAPCARDIVERLAAQAYRRPVSASDVDPLMQLYELGRKEGDFESGVRMALQALLASPHFLFRLEDRPAGAQPGRAYRVADLELASRLSYFLWATSPDAALMEAARTGALRTKAALEKQVRRMLADPRSEALATRFASQWLRLQDLEKIHPDALLYPSYDHTLAEALKRETELLFDSLVREDGSVLELLTADYTFVNERVARHYGIPNIVGEAFRRVQLPGENRRGILGHGSILTLTSVADRTSPVMRGKWVLEVLLGTTPPPPPPNVPELAVNVKAGRLLTVRERMEEHRANPACTSCHRVIDPIGLALENFDATGAWRIRDNGAPVDSSGELYDGTNLQGPAGLRDALLKRSEVFLRSFTESLMTYALGRRVEHQDMPAVRAIVRDAGRDGHRMSAYILGIVRGAAFQMRRSDGPSMTNTAQNPAAAAVRNQ